MVEVAILYPYEEYFLVIQISDKLMSVFQMNCSGIWIVTANCSLKTDLKPAITLINTAQGKSKKLVNLHVACINGSGKARSGSVTDWSWLPVLGKETVLVLGTREELAGFR